jgi:O-antigen ligase
MSLFGQPITGLYALIMLLPYRTLRDHFIDYPLGGNVVTILVLCVILGALIKGKRLPRSGLYVIWFIFAGYLYLSMWLGVAVSNAPAPIWIHDVNLATWKDYMVLPLVFVAAGLTVQTRRDVRMVILLTAISVLMIDRSALLNSLSRSWNHFDENKRDGGPLGFAGSNGLAAFLAQFSMFFWGFVQFVKRRKAKLLLYGLIAATVMATMYSFSRAGYIAVVAGAFLLGVLKDRKLIVVVGIFLFTWQAIVPTAVTERVTMTQNSSGELEASAQERVDLWTAAKETIAANPIFGIGYATYQLTAHTDNLRDTHNWYIKVMLETGAIGMIMAVAMLIMMLALSFRIFRKGVDPLYRGLGLGLVLLVSCSIVLNCFGDRWTYIEINGLLWVLLGAGARADALRHNVTAELPGTVEEAEPQMPAHLAYR